mgnify:CR=1 FL=1
MEQSTTTVAKRSQRDYTMGFKLAVVEQVEQGDYTYKQIQNAYGIQGRSTVLVWLRKHGTLDWSKPALVMKSPRKETPAQKIKRLERELSDERLKNKVLNTMVDLAEEQFRAPIRKKFSPDQSNDSEPRSE